MMHCKTLSATLAVYIALLLIMSCATDAIVFSIKSQPMILTTSLSKPSKEPACKVWADIIDINYVGKQSIGKESAGASSILCAGRQKPARYLLNTRIRKPGSAVQDGSTYGTSCEKIYPLGKEIELTILLPTLSPASQLRDRDIIEGTIQLGSDVCDHGVYLTNLRIPTKEELSRLGSNTKSLSSIAPPGKLLSAFAFKTCKKFPSPACPGGRIVQGVKGSDGCFGLPVCIYPQLPGTCANRCGWTSGAGRCRCDIQCKSHGDCCTDYVYLCVEKTCPTVRDPVCSLDGKTYGNACLAQKSLATVICRGECPCKQNCPIYKEPICLEGTIVPGSELPRAKARGVLG